MIRRNGFTLPELLVAMAIAALLGVTLIAILARQQRAYAGLDATLTMRTHLHDAMGILSADLRSAAQSDTFAVTMDTAMQFFATVGASSTCAATSTPRIPLPPRTPTDHALVTSWLTLPDSGDVLLAYHDSTATDPTRYWRRFAIDRVTPRAAATVCTPSTWPLVDSDLYAANLAYDVFVTTAPASTIDAGTPIRFLRLSRYSVYRASDGFWYLGYRRCHPLTSLCDGVQPVSGPYRKGGTPPIRFEYYRANGTAITSTGPNTHIARIDFTAIDDTRHVIRIAGQPSGIHADSVITSIALRNR
jgi:prepilin-type N-terminal cleavage/methylation domain-containing protein